MKKIFLTALIILIAGMMGCQKSPANRPELFSKEQFKINPPDFIPVSVWYSGGKARAPMLSTITENSATEWRKDLQQIKDLGFNTVRTWVEWAHCEPRPGEYHFENLKLLARTAQDIGLRFIIQLYVDLAPDWVGKKYPDGMYEAQNGAKVQSQAAPGFCSDHPGVREAVSNFITETAKIAVQYPNFHGWDLWSEPHIVNWAYINYVPNVQFCFCPYTREYFRDWLKVKYESLENLNQAWYRNFGSWEDVDPPRFGTILSYTDFIDWKNFIYYKLAADLGMRYSAVRRGDTTHVITSHAAVPSVFYTPYNGYGATDDFLMAEKVDYYGTSLYPKHNHPSRHWEDWRFMVAVDFSRSANMKNGGFYVGELQAGKGTYGLNVGNPITPGDHRIWMWSVLSRGARAINIYAYYPMSSGYESGGYGLINLDGSVTERAIAAGKTAQIITKNKDLLLSSAPVKAEIALVYNPLAQMVGGEQSHVSGDMHQLSLFGYYRTLAENNIPVDFIQRRDVEAKSLSQYKLVIVPYPLMFTQKAADALKDFVKQGGYLVSEARPAWNDERGYAAEVIPGMGLDEVFGVREEKVKMIEKVAVTLNSTANPLLKDLSGKGLQGAYFAESLSPLVGSVEILGQFEDKSSGLAVNKYGEGEALLIGSFLGMATHQQQIKENKTFILNMVSWAKVDKPFTWSADKKLSAALDIRLHQNEEGYIVFVINHNDEEVQVKINIKTHVEGVYHVTDLISAQERNASVRDKVLTIELRVKAQDVQVLNLAGHP